MDLSVARSGDPTLDCDLDHRRGSSSTTYEHLQEHQAHQEPEPPTGTTARKRRGSGEPSKQLACSSCRKKKIKCQPNVDGGRCRACLRSGAECLIPAIDERKLSNSKKLVRELYAKIASLEAELQTYRGGCRTQNCQDDRTRVESLVHRDDDDGTKTPDGGDELDGPVSPSNQSDKSGASDNMIIRLCGGYRQLNSDRVGRPRYFGPKSSLHLTGSVTSSILLRMPATNTGGMLWQDVLSSSLQDHLFELYWTYQHQVIPIIHKEAFLQDFRSGQTKYCSKLLVHCILARAASISDRPDIRAMALVEDEVNEDPPLLVRRCADLLDAELNQPGITTLQSLELMSEIYCVFSNDTKGWMDAGGASRLAFELGLHSDIEGFNTTNLSQVEIEIRQICFWSCFSFDRQWALYLGRPQMIKLDDVTVHKPNTRPTSHKTSLELRMSAAWANLLEIVGMLCDALNGAQTTRHRVAALDRSFRDWYTNLDAEFRYNPQQIPAVFHLHMQYSAAVILLHRPLAQFGNVQDDQPQQQRHSHPYHHGRSQPHRTPPKETSRQICVQHACLIAQYLQQYEECHGSLRTLSWVTLHMIGTAATTLIATLSERRDSTHSNTYYLVSSLQTCIRSLCELEESHLPTRRVRKLILHAMRLLNLESKLTTTANMSTSSWSTSTLSSSSSTSMTLFTPIHTSSGTWDSASLDIPIGGIWGGEAHSTAHAEATAFDEFLPPGNYGSHAEMLMSFESLFY